VFALPGLVLLWFMRERITILSKKDSAKT
jgi:hypothetical protein